MTQARCHRHFWFSILAFVLIYALYPFINAFFWALILYVIFKPLYTYMTGRMKINKGISAFTIIILTIILILVPLYILMTIVLFQTQNFLLNTNTIFGYMNSFNLYITQLHLEKLTLDINISQKMAEVISSAANFLGLLLVNAIQSMGQRIIEFVIMFFLR